MEYTIPLMADLLQQNKKPEYLFWVGCAGAFDQRYRKVTQAFAKILIHLGTDFGCLGAEETCTGDPARRAGNEMLYQMQALQVIETLKAYDVKKIIAICPHCFNIFKNEYPDLGGNYEVIHYTQFLRDALDNGKLKISSDVFSGKNVTFHDPCYLGRANDEYEAPRTILQKACTQITELPRNKSFALCCGAGGAQMFKETEAGDSEVFAERTREVVESKADIVATSCPFCMTMFTDGIKFIDKQDEIKNLDIAEIVAQALKL
ncbi:MAG: (Fe-S)-binding protein [Bacteroidales bacterium]|nr:(Fe-S)-binding protein [Bacteroidales bacterium]